jgi:hypothetical protein
MGVVVNMTSEIWNKDEEWVPAEEHADIHIYEIVSVGSGGTKSTSNKTVNVFECL